MKTKEISDALWLTKRTTINWINRLIHKNVVIQSYKTGEMKLDEVPRPQVMAGMVVVETRASLVSAGTEKMLVNTANAFYPFQLKAILGKKSEVV